ncbi:Late embryogenesis abundant protein [Macleaya cordata]|uniref:Late embryogenesis abundant protein n=1 Tax=Macleaya cordata TaxID=56857 RepID=A0A200R2J0_MACCD|nr:Late embryogenesis abundant protein [Macleaya cordata]
MGEDNQSRPLPPASDRINGDEEATKDIKSNKFPRKKHMKCCGCCCMVTVLILVAIFLVLLFTLFLSKDPKIKMNGLTIMRIKLINGTIPDPTVNITLIADVSVKNPNAATFKYSNSTSALYYRGNLVGEVQIPPGMAKPRRTQRMNVTVEMNTARLFSDPNVQNDIANSQALAMTSLTSIGGRMKVFKIIKRHIVVKMNCRMNFNLTSMSIQDQKCKRKMSF